MSDLNLRQINQAEGTTLFLPVEWQHPGLARESRVAWEALLEAVLAFPEPFSLQYVLAAGGGEATSAGLLVSALDEISTRRTIGLVSLIASSVNNWGGFGTPHDPPDRPPAANRFALDETHGEGRQIFNHRSPAWTVASRLETRTTMFVDLLGNVSDPELGVRCRVRIEGNGTDASLVASLIASDLCGPLRLNPVPLRGELAPELTLDLSMAAHLVSTAARIDGVWPTTVMTPVAQIHDAIDKAVPPHTVVFGGTGLGKTTLLEHLADRSLRDGRTVVAMCPHGDLAARVAALAQVNGSLMDVIDFGDSEHPPEWNLCTTPPGITPEAWADELVHMIRNVWATMPEIYFGPVWRRTMRAALRVLVEDPAGPHRLTELPDVIRNPKKWTAAVDRIGDSELRLVLKEAADAVAHDRERSYANFVFGKLEPFLGQPDLASMLDQPGSTVDTSQVLHGRSLAVAAPISAVGDEGSTLVVSAVLSQVWQQIRNWSGPTPRIDILVDEAQRFPAHILKPLLAESRKFGIRLRLATQSPASFAEETRESVLSNCGAVGTFRLSPRGAAELDDLFPLIPAKAMTSLERHSMAITFGDVDRVARMAPPLVEESAAANARTALHLQTHRRLRAGDPTARSEVLTQLVSALARYHARQPQDADLV